MQRAVGGQTFYPVKQRTPGFPVPFSSSLISLESLGGGRGKSKEKINEQKRLPF